MSMTAWWQTEQMAIFSECFTPSQMLCEQQFKKMWLAGHVSWRRHVIDFDRDKWELAMTELLRKLRENSA